MSEVKKQWKEREDLSISELEDIWFANRNLEMARSIILAVKDFQKITLEEKLEFLRSVFYEDSNLRYEGAEYEKLKKYIKAPVLETFLFLLPEWKPEFAEKTENGRLILSLLSHKDIYSYISVPAGQIKKFVHSYLNSVKKEEMDEDRIVEVLINNQMFEELVNYNFISDEAVNKIGEKATTVGRPLNLIPYFKENLRAHIIEALKENRESHAVSVFLRLLAKRGDLDKIFREPKPKDYPMRDPDPTKIISG